LNIIYNFYQWIIKGDNIETLDSKNIEEINEFLDLINNYYNSNYKKGYKVEEEYDIDE